MTAKIGIVGVGWWATFNHIPTVQAHPRGEVVALCDLDGHRLEVAAKTFGIHSCYQNLDEMIAQEALDGLIVSTPHSAHKTPTLAGLAAGCHVLVEKPMATRTEDARAIAAAAEAAQREVLVPTGLNFEGYSQTAAGWVAEGRIGEIRHAVCQMASPLHDLFAGEPMAETADHLFRPPASTWADPNNAGGYAWGQMSHSLAWLYYVTQLKVEQVFALAGKSKAGVDMYDAASARASNGATLVFSGAGTVPKHRGMHTDIKLYGEEGMIRFDNQAARVELWRHDQLDEVVELTNRPEYDGALPVKVFVELCAGEAVVNASNAHCGAEVTATLDALYRSVASGQPEAVR